MVLIYKNFEKGFKNLKYYEYKNLVLFGSSHIGKDSIEAIKQLIDDYDPDIVAVELDSHRLYHLLSNQKSKISIKDIKRFGLTGFLFGVIGQYLQKKLGDIVGIKPGSDMLTAVQLANEKGKILELIDRDIERTLISLNRQFNRKEKLRLFWDFLKGLIIRDKLITFDISKTPSYELIDVLMKELKMRYPGLYNALVDERNLIMASKLFVLMGSNKKIFAVVGAGHVKGIMDLLLKTDVNYYDHNKKQNNKDEDKKENDKALNSIDNHKNKTK